MIDRTPCPACGGDPLPGALAYRHRTSCRIYAADSATIAADHERRSGVRPPTNAEREILRHERYVEPEGDLVLGIRFNHRTGVHRRRPVLVDGTGREVADAEREVDDE